MIFALSCLISLHLFSQAPYQSARTVTGESYSNIETVYDMEGSWGMETIIDLKSCDPELIRDAQAIEQYVRELCNLIDMKRFGETQVVHFGEDEKVAGYSMVQLIETSLISAHFANLSNAVYLDVFSCKPYMPEMVQDFAKKFFGGTSSTLNVSLRM